MSAFTGVVVQTEMRKRLDNASYGYYRVNVATPAFGKDSWGFYNNRELITDTVVKLKGEYHRMGPLTCQTDKVMYMAVRPEWIANLEDGKGKIDGLYIWDVPELALTEAGKQAIVDRLFKPLSGNHRREALVLYIRDLEEELKELEEAEKSPKLIAVEKAKLEAELATLKERLTWAPFWTFQIFDSGACRFRCFLNCFLITGATIRQIKRRRGGGRSVFIFVGEQHTPGQSSRRGRLSSHVDGENNRGRSQRRSRCAAHPGSRRAAPESSGVGEGIGDAGEGR